ncbi:MAG: glycosyltransferase [Gemmatimonadaceae bacterium]
MTQGPLRVVISGHEICGLIHDLEGELKRRGNEVVTVAMTHRYFPYSYDYDQHSFPISFFSRRFGLRVLWQRAFQALWEINRNWHESLEGRLRRRLVSGADLYIQVWGDLPFDSEVLKGLEGSGTRVATLLMGSDVRDYDVFRQEYDITSWRFPPEYHSVTLEKKLQILRTHERFADAVFSVPDQMGLALRSYHHLQVPLQLERFTYNVPQRKIPRVVHAPSVPHIKGSDVIERALETLRCEGVEFELISVRDMPHDKLLELLADSDVLVDELIAHGPGWLSFEAMASGCAVATHYLDNSPECFRPPVWSIDEHNIVDRLKTLLTDSELRIELAEKGRRYVEQHNTMEHVVDELLRKVQDGRDACHDYVPSYLTTSYVPNDEAEAGVINAANSSVAGEKWYRENVAGKSHDGLVF